MELDDFELHRFILLMIVPKVHDLIEITKRDAKHPKGYILHARVKAVNIGEDLLIVKPVDVREGKRLVLKLSQTTISIVEFARGKNYGRLRDSTFKQT